MVYFLLGQAFRRLPRAGASPCTPRGDTFQAALSLCPRHRVSSSLPTIVAWLTFWRIIMPSLPLGAKWIFRLPYWGANGCFNAGVNNRQPETHPRAPTAYLQAVLWFQKTKGQPENPTRLQQSLVSTLHVALRHTLYTQIKDLDKGARLPQSIQLSSWMTFFNTASARTASLLPCSAAACHHFRASW